jgi:hypothetical protein
MAETFDSFLKKMQDGQDSAKTMKWYLKQIHDLVAEKNVGSGAATKGKGGKTPSSGETMADYIEQREQSRPQARKEVEGYAIETTNAPTQQFVGKMLFYKYDAKMKQELPYWDQFPLVFPWRINGKYMWGMNMHYLPPVERAKLMYALFSTANSTELSEQTKLVITYKLLNESTKYIYFRPCIKQYIVGNIKSRVIVVNPMEWNHVLLMPLAGFMKQSEYKVWQDSVEMIRKAQFNK